MTDRRVLLLTAALAVGSLVAGAWLASRATRVADERGVQIEIARDTAFGDASRRAALEAALDSLVREAAGEHGRAGLALRDVRTRAELYSGRPDADGSTTFPMASVHTVPLAVAALAADAMGTISLEDTVDFPGQAAGGRRTLDEVLELAVAHGDSAAAGMLLSTVGGPDSVLKRLQVLEVQGVDADSAEPAGIAEMFARLSTGRLLPPPHTERLLQLLETPAATSPLLLRAGVPPGTPIWNRTGTGSRSGDRIAAFNDVAILERPDGRRIVVALFITGSEVDSDRLADLAAAVSRAVLGG